MSLLRRLLTGSGSEAQRLSLDEYLDFFNFDGLAYPITSMGRTKEQEPGSDFAGYVSGIYQANGIVWACMAARMLLFSEARFQFQQMRDGRPGDLFGTQELRAMGLSGFEDELRLLEQPNGPTSSDTTGDLLSRAIQDVDCAGNWFGYRDGDSIVRWRPDYVKIIAGSSSGRARDAVPVGYVYAPPDEPEIIALPFEVAHFAPYPDPTARFRGMSWLTPIVREVMADQAATTHKLKFFENGATPNLVVQTGIKTSANTDLFDRWIEKFKANHQGVGQAFKTLFLAEGADAKVVGSSLEQASFEAVQAAGETRIAAAAGIPPIIVGFSKGLEAGTLSNYSQAMRRLADGTMRPLWRNFAGSISSLLKVPESARLWYDTRDIAWLRADEADAANVQQTEAATISTLITAGFEPESVVAAVRNNDFTLLVHSGRYSVQLLPPGSGESPTPAVDGEDAIDRTGRALLALTAGTGGE